MLVRNGAITIELRKSTIRDGWLRLAIFNKLKALDGKSDRDTEYHVFARVCSQAKVEGLPFPLPTSAEDDAAILTTWNDWANVITEDFHDELVVAIARLIEPADATTGPQPLAEGAEKN